MTKFFLILTAAALLAGAVFSFQNRTAFVETREKRAANNKKIDNILKEFEDLDVASVHDKIYEEEGRLEIARSEFENSQQNISALKNEISELQGQLAPLDSELNKAQLAIDQIRIKFPGVDKDNIGPKIKEIELKLEDTKQELAAKKAEIELMEKRVASNNAAVGRYQKRQAERLAKIRGNAIEGTITAVNNDWGFVVLNMGTSQGVSEETNLIVKRSGNRVAYLSPVSVQSGTTVANIDQRSLTGVIQPGDRVIFQSTSR